MKGRRQIRMKLTQSLKQQLLTSMNTHLAKKERNLIG